MELEDLVLKTYRIEKVLDGFHPNRFKMVATADPDGLYKAPSAENIERALNTNCSIRKTDNLFVRTRMKNGFGKWQPMSRR